MANGLADALRSGLIGTRRLPSAPNRQSARLRPEQGDLLRVGGRVNHRLIAECRPLARRFCLPCVMFC